MLRLYFCTVLPALSIYVCLALQPGNEKPKKINNEAAREMPFKRLDITGNVFSTKMMIEISDTSKLNQFQEYIDHVRKRGVEVIKGTTIQIMQEIKPNKTLTQDMESAIDEYDNKIEYYANENYVTLLKSKSYVDELYMYLDVLNTAYRYLLREQRNCFHHIAHTTTNSTNNINFPKESALNLYRIIYKQTVSFRKEELFYVCHNHNVCKSYSSFILYFDAFLNVIMTLPSYDFKRFLELLNSLIINDEYFMEITNANTDIINNINAFFSDPSSVLESFEVLRALLLHRYKILNIPNLRRKSKVQAVRFILDTLEKALAFDHNKEVLSHMETAFIAVKEWKNASIYGREDEAGDDISDFINGIFKALSRTGDYFLPYFIDTILTGNLVKTEGYKVLFRNGSKNVFDVDETF